MTKLIFFLVFSFGLKAETFVFGESYRTLKKSGSYQTNVVWGQQSFGQKVGGFGWGQYGTTYQQTYAGIYLKPASWLQVGAATGQEQWSKTPRLGSFAFAAKKKTSVFAIYENFGATGRWYLVLIDYSISKRVSVGSHSQAFIGHGPRAEIRLKKIGNWTASVRPAATWDKQSGTRPNVLIGVRFTYFKGD